jgi:DNA processing protein
LPRAPRPLADAEKIEWLRLLRSEGVGPVTFFHLVRFYGGAAKALAALPELARRSGRKAPIRIGTEKDAERELAAVKRAGAVLLGWLEPAYPVPLAAIEDAPPLVTARGDVALLAKRNIAVVGARNASANGRAFAETIARDLGKAGFVVASGLARGIDAAAHRGALAAGGRTIAVLGSGLLEMYPPEHEKLADEVAASGYLLSESPPRMKPLSGAFPQRNRIISGLSVGTIVVEAADRSGALITARHAYEQGREVFAVPGPIDSRVSHGCHALIKDGAKLVESIDDVLAELGPLAENIHRDDGTTISSPAELLLNEIEQQVLAAIDGAPMSVDAVAKSSGLPIHRVLSTISVLEMRRLVRRVSGTQVMRSYS